MKTTGACAFTMLVSKSVPNFENSLRSCSTSLRLSGGRSQSGIVRMAFALVAAARKSSTVFSSAAQRLIVSAKRKTDRYKVFMRKGLVDRNNDDCVEELAGKAKTRPIIP